MVLTEAKRQAAQQRDPRDPEWTNHLVHESLGEDSSAMDQWDRVTNYIQKGT